MKQLCIRLDDKTSQKIQNKAIEKELSQSEYIRRLVELGFRIEAMSDNTSEEKNSGSESISAVQDLWGKSLSWSLEMLFLVRILSDKMLSENDEKSKNLLRESKIRAENFVSGLLNQEVEAN